MTDLQSTILVTGGAGFIGSALVRHLVLDKGLRVVTLDKLGYAGSLLNLREVEENPLHTFVQADICDRPALEAVLREHQPDTVMHARGRRGPRSLRKALPRSIGRIGVGGTRGRY